MYITKSVAYIATHPGIQPFLLLYVISVDSVLTCRNYTDLVGLRYSKGALLVWNALRNVFYADNGRPDAAVFCSGVLAQLRKPSWSTVQDQRTRWTT